MKPGRKPHNRLIHGVSSCIFCDATPTTKEHLWPKYVREFEERQRAGRTVTLQHAVVTAVATEQGHSYSSTLRPRGVDGVSITLKVLCKRCNDRFSRNIQLKCRDELLSVLSRQISFDYIPSKQMLHWVLLFTLCCSFDTNHDRTINFSTLSNFRKGMFPKTFSVYYRFGDESCPILSYDRRFQHEIFSFDPEGNPFSDRKQVVAARQSFTLSLGSIIFYTYSHEALVPNYRGYRAVNFDPITLKSKYQLSELWPTTDVRLAAPLNLQQINDLSDELHGPEHVGKFRALNDTTFVPTHS